MSPAVFDSETRKDRTAVEAGELHPAVLANQDRLLSYLDEQDAHLRRLPVLELATCVVLERGRPPEPGKNGHAWYRGWEVGYSGESAYWAGEGWIAYKGGCDLDAPEVRAATYQGCLDEVNEREDEA